MIKWILRAARMALRQLCRPTGKQADELQTKKNKFALSPITYETYSRRF
jgi:hypothetical protein